jgi:hypothetical protein
VRRKRLQVELGAGAAGLLGGAWGVESMRASSPTHAKAAAALAAGVDDERAAWMVRHPSALGKFEQIVAASEGKRIVMFLDYDGTLSPIVDDPDAAFMSETVSSPSALRARRHRMSSSLQTVTDTYALILYCEQADADGRAQRRQALPDGDRQRPVPRQGTHAKAIGIPHCCQHHSPSPTATNKPTLIFFRPDATSRCSSS